MLLATAGWIVTGVGFAGALYAVAAVLLAQRVLNRTPDPPPLSWPPVTVLKPLHGLEPGLEAALASVLSQDYPAPVQIVFGLQDPADPARATAERLRARFPGRQIDIVVDSREHGANRKVSNLVNMNETTRHDVVVLADSDMRVPPDYLKSVVSALDRDGVGAVSCLYTGIGLAGPWSRIAAMGIAYQFLPNALFGIATGLAQPSFGSTIALTRSMLAEIGGFEAFRDLLADDYEIGRAVRARGRRMAYPPMVLTHHCTEERPGALLSHELRWARTIRTIDPAGHWGSVVTHALGVGLIGAALLGFTPATCVVLATILAARLFLKVRIDHIVGAAAGPAWLLPARDLVSFGLFIASLFGSAVEWRGRRLRVRRSGAMSQP